MYTPRINRKTLIIVPGMLLNRNVKTKPIKPTITRTSAIPPTLYALIAVVANLFVPVNISSCFLG